MNVTDLHPEELLAKERERTLTQAERATLDTHLRLCTVCSLLRQARSDFAAERMTWQVNEGAVSRLAPRVIREIEQNATRSPAPPNGDTLRANQSGRSRLRHSTRYAIATVLLAGTAAASYWVAGKYELRRDSVAHIQPTGRGGRGICGPLQHIPNAQVVSAGSVEPKPSQNHEAGPAGPTLNKRAPSPRTRTAFELFEQATSARVAGDYGRALHLYRVLERNYPDSVESRASHATVARLLLDLGQPDAALADLGHYLKHHPVALEERAMVDRALAYQRMGRSNEERSAWQALLRAYPISLHAKRALARLSVLDAKAEE